MERVTFTTPAGEAIFGLDSPYRLEKTEGFRDGEITSTVTQYIDMDGGSVSGILYEPRSLIVNGYLQAGSRKELAELRRKLSRLCGCKQEGVLKYICEGREYVTTALPDSLPQWGDVLQNTQRFVCYFTAYGFYWESAKENKEHILKTTNNLVFPFTFPGYFGYTVTRQNISNEGDAPAPCVITIEGTAAGGVSTFALTEGLEIINHTTGEHILIAYDIADTERIVIDTGVPSIISSVSGNILHKLSFADDDTYTTEFFQLVPGQNDIECVNYNPANRITANIRYRDRYAGV